MSRVLVSDGSGFVSSHVAEYFAKKDFEVAVFDDLSRTCIEKKHWGPTIQLEYLKPNHSGIDSIERMRYKAT